MISQEIETTSRISLLLHKSEAGLRLSVSNKDILQVQVGFYSIALLVCQDNVRIP